MKHVVMFSGGIGSWATAKRVIDRHGPADVTLLFADVRGEDADCYRFINDAARQLKAELVTVRDGRTIWDVFKDDRFLGNSRLANCSKFLKQKPCHDWLEANCDPSDTVVYVGIDWQEIHRLPAIKKAYLPYVAEAPMTRWPYLDKQQMLDMARADGLEPPRMYAQGYPHANCAGACVRAGQAQWQHLLIENRELYLDSERHEQELRDYLNKDVAILRDRTDGNSVPLTLRSFRERIEEQPSLFDDLEWGGCGCFVEEAS
jgi:3'-phosphoadenosine 5'-phosphosulfate sulfotransferase (PAPS reductase)/FAD synthetase